MMKIQRNQYVDKKSLLIHNFYCFQMTDNELVYTSNLLYTHVALVGTLIVRADAAAVGIEFHYSR